MDRHRAIIAPKFATVLGSSSAIWRAWAWRLDVPRGGYFISLDVLDGCAKEVVRLAKRRASS